MAKASFLKNVVQESSNGWQAPYKNIGPTGWYIMKEWILNRIPNNLLNYKPHGKRSLGQQLKRWSETITGYVGCHLPKLVFRSQILLP
jgi:hypothetical protein